MDREEAASSKADSARATPAARAAVAALVVPVSLSAAQKSGGLRGAPAETGFRFRRADGWNLVESPNFRCCSTSMGAAELQVAARECERLRSRLQECWGLADGSAPWSPRCDVVVHADLGAYVRSLGGDVGRSVGCATVTTDAGRVVARRIDVRADAADWTTGALPHELMHVVLADRFLGRPIPRWIDEGLGVLAESAAHRARRRSALRLARESGSLLPVARLVTLDRPASAAEIDAFYAQSVELVERLVARESPERFLEFVESAIEQGQARALRDVYGFAEAGDLHRLLVE